MIIEPETHVADCTKTPAIKKTKTKQTEKLSIILIHVISILNIVLINFITIVNI